MEELRRVKLQRMGSGGDHPPGGACTVPARYLEFITNVATEGAYEAPCTTGNTAPGADEINFRLSRLAWLTLVT